MSELIGRTFGSYEILSQLGEGGMATVYLGRQETMDRLVAIKVIAAMYSRDEKFRARFDQEAHTIARLEHPHILPVIDYGEQDFGA
ncbi:MAG: protein kinase, partial [Anaerolineae bacterium]|nr:protein kinase [Anaerolineae bacterium]